MSTSYCIMIRLEIGGCVEESHSCERVFIQDGVLTLCNLIKKDDPLELAHYELVRAYAPGKWVTCFKESNI